jgi:acyl-homoserine-lactone acylase
MRMLEEEARFTLDEVVASANATEVEMADRLLDDLVAAARRDGRPEVREAAEVLAAWDRQTEADSQGAVLFLFWGNAVTAAARAASTALFAFPWDEDAPLATPDGFADPAAVVAALAEVADAVRAAFGALDVAWGDAVRLRYDAVDLPAVGGPGDPFGVFRVVCGLLGPRPGRAAATHGNASQPGSPHVGDQLALFARKEMRPAWLTRAEVEANLGARDLLPR